MSEPDHELEVLEDDQNAPPRPEESVADADRVDVDVDVDPTTDPAAATTDPVAEQA